MAFWLYRGGQQIYDFNGGRALWGETWLTEDPPIGGHSQAEISSVSSRLRAPFGVAADRPFIKSVFFFDLLWPPPARSTGTLQAPSALTGTLNPAAPEAAFRLQRVGASGRFGRIAVPILEDKWFADLPHRRHVDMEFLAPLVMSDPFLYPMSFTTFLGRHFQNVLFNRRNHTWEPIVRYELHPNPIRIWNRWRPTPTPPHVEGSPLWAPSVEF